MKNSLVYVFFFIYVSVSVASYADVTKVTARGLFKNGAILEIDGKRRVLKAGKTSPEGVTLIRADSKSALVRIDGVEKTLSIVSQIGGRYTAPEKKEVHFSQKEGGHYYGEAVINGRSMPFLIDTGATSIAINSHTASSLGIQYKQGSPVTVTTANGYARAYQVTLSKVRIGTIELYKVGALVLEGKHPVNILLGNSFLSRVEMNIEGNILTLSTKY